MVDALPEALSGREQEILTFLADGLSNQEIANKLFLADQTVRWYCSQLYGKLGVANRKEAVERAQTLGLFAKAAPSSTVQGKHNLPAQATPFVGRQHELVDLTQLLYDENTRLITILAPGGMGKTRLALEAARLQIGRYADGVIFVPLAPLSSPSDIVTTIAENIGFVFHGESTPAQQLIDFLRDRSMFLVLDNFEHLMDGAQLVADLIQSAPNVRLLTTSRERLNLRGETVYTLRGLEFPKWETPEDALQYDAVKLFMQSAHRVRVDFALQSHDLDFLARICRLTAGLPLGIELAAGWVDVLSLEQIATEIQKGIDILETEMRDVPERQRSVRATFNYSWERLTADEQNVFMHLSVFRGGFTVEAAQTVAGASVRSLKQLANKALLQVSPDGRHDIHELLRQFGAEKLVASGEETTIQTKHTAYFVDFMAERNQDVHTNRQLEALELIDPDFENVRSAWLSVVNLHEWDQLPKFLHSLWFYLDMRTRGQDAVILLEQAVKALESVPSAATTELAIGRILARLAWFYNDIGFPDKATEISDQAIRILRQYESLADLLAALEGRINVGIYQNEQDTLAYVAQEGLSVARSIGDNSYEGLFLVSLGGTSQDIVEGLYLAQEGLSILEAVGHRWYMDIAYHVLSDIEFRRKNYQQAKRWFEQWRLIAETFGHAFGLADCSVFIARLALEESDYATAYLHLGKALRIYWDAGYKWFSAFPLAYIVQILTYQDELERAVELWAAIHKHLPPSMLIEPIIQALPHNLETKLDPQRFAAAWTRGEKRELGAVVTELLIELDKA